MYKHDGIFLVNDGIKPTNNYSFELSHTCDRRHHHATFMGGTKHY